MHNKAMLSPSTIITAVCFWILPLLAQASEQITDTVLMIPPKHFLANPETLETNPFQKDDLRPVEEVRLKALNEFNTMVEKLQKAHIQVIKMDQPDSPVTPDGVFPNNWFISFSPDYPLPTSPGFASNTNISFFPMLAENRKQEVDLFNLGSTLGKRGIGSYFDDPDFREVSPGILEGTGSMVLDRVHRVAYAALSARTNQQALNRFAEVSGYRVISFHTGEDHQAIYHTNVILSVGEDFAILCEECISDPSERALVLDNLKGREIITIDRAQVGMMSGNILQLKNTEGKRYIVMSESARWGLSITQLRRLKAHGKLLSSSLTTIEQYGGGSARCMMAEIFYQ